ncbi:ABC transporter substrate-binding protein [Aureimonas populi]|uniref:PotD/PotF family extracellular solute-binding protein n=1 Tax=Aureimonas populi TaxID=1701758 RepID=A0ABW5CQD2_9HYPH|nr:extracellular solute-binding protein [Aureimonas populi]
MSRDTMHSGLGRRSLLKGMAGFAGLAALGLPARAQGAGRVVVGTWGGDYARLLNEHIEAALLTPEGWEVIQDQAGDPERRSKMLAERRLPRGTTDLQGLNGPNMYQVYELGITQEIDYDRIPNAANLMPSMRYEYGIGHIYSGMVCLYNPDMLEAPASYAASFDPALGNRLGFIDIQYQYTMIAAALAAGGSVTAIDAGKEMLLEARRAGARIYPTNEAFAQALSAEEIGAGIMWKARAVQWQDAGINIQSVAPSEGALSYVSGFVIPRNAPNVDGAYAYLNAMLEPSAQEGFARDMGYNPTVENAEVPAELNERIGFTAEEVAALNDPDYGFILENDVEMKEWWDREFKA